MRLNFSIWRFVCALSLIGTLGCAGVRTPNFAHPGTAAEQRADAERFDPFLDPYAGPEVVGGRPLGFTRPLTDTEWANRYGRRAVPLVPSTLPVVTAPPVVTNPFAPPPPAITATPPISTAPPPITSAPPATLTPMYPTSPPLAPAPISPQQLRPRAPY